MESWQRSIVKEADLVAFFPDSQRALIEWRRELEILELDSGARKPLFARPRGTSIAALDPDGKRLVAGGGGGVFLASLATPSRAPKPIEAGLTALAWAPDGRSFAMSAFLPEYLVGTGVLVFDDDATSPRLHWDVPPLEDDLELEINDLWWSPDGSIVWTADDGGTRVSEMRGITASGTARVRGWPIDGSEPIELTPTEGYPGFNTLAGNDDSLCASTGDKIVVWDLGSHRLLRELRTHSRSLAMLPDGRLVCGADRDAVEIWQPRRNRRDARLECSTSDPIAPKVAASADGNWIAASVGLGIDLWRRQN